MNRMQLLKGALSLAAAGAPLPGLAGDRYQLGVDETVPVPLTIQPVNAVFRETGRNSISGTVNLPAGKDIRIPLQQFGAGNFPGRPSGGPPPTRKNMDTITRRGLTRRGKLLPLKTRQDKMVLSGLSWGGGEIRACSFDRSAPCQ
jgi:hypothetical protein